MLIATADEGLAVLAGLRRESAVADFRRIDGMLRYLDGISATGYEFAARVSTIAQALGWSENVVQNRVAEAQAVREQLPATWEAFGEGRLDGQRVAEVGREMAKLAHAQSFERLDGRIARYAESHTVGELRSWLKRRVAMAEPEHAAERYEDLYRERSIRVTHSDDGTGDLYANHLPSIVLADIEARLDRAARAIHDPDDERTLDQKRADLFVGALGEIDPAHDGAKAPAVAIGVMVPASTLAGVDDQPGISADRDWTIPADLVRELATEANPFWYRLLVDETGEDILETVYSGRYPPEHLRNAIRFRDGTCRYPGCRVKASRCEVDHRIPVPYGPTAGFNNWSLCKRHHDRKTFRAALPTHDGEHWPIGDTILIE
ncbi:DUF222 domain-containing protein [Aeromicrobium sp. YIM 150415]|uniref:HNH endonuclease signature motif containing protein n=1 Tax=Aeromicrobium sp. YIM 150415 TaxID=2803912 RepID=UPI001964EB03|nr:HNH endonuclease signature motif containing protein [Aeromicrobium sp. YIM 150415]MBM9462207.1 DUF222 domain-containing protein [Aeromicrobium sp. YIM 150415]